MTVTPRDTTKWLYKPLRNVGSTDEQAWALIDAVRNWATHENAGIQRHLEAEQQAYREMDMSRAKEWTRAQSLTVMLKDAYEIVHLLEVELAEKGGFHLVPGDSTLANRIQDWRRDTHRIISDHQGTTSPGDVVICNCGALAPFDHIRSCPLFRRP